MSQSKDQSLACGSGMDTGCRDLWCWQLLDFGGEHMAGRDETVASYHFAFWGLAIEQ